MPTAAYAQPSRLSCPNGTTGYTGELQPWSCVAVYRDQSGHDVLLRSGRSGAAGFGLVHALVDHDLEESLIADAMLTAYCLGLAKCSDEVNDAV